MEILNFNLQVGRSRKDGTWSFSTFIQNSSEAESAILVITETQFLY
jgi:hypothetical protein